MTTNTQPSIDTPEFRSLCATYGSHWKEWRINHCADAMDELIAHINTWGAAQRAEAVKAADDFRALVSDSDAAEIKEWKARALKAEAELARVKAEIENLPYIGGAISCISRPRVIEIFQPPATDTSGLPG